MSSNTIEVLYAATKRSHLNAAENFCFYTESKNNNEKFSVQGMMQPNAVFKACYNVIHTTTTLKHKPFAVTLVWALWGRNLVSVEHCIPKALRFDTIPFCKYWKKLRIHYSEFLIVGHFWCHNLTFLRKNFT